MRKTQALIAIMVLIGLSALMGCVSSGNRVQDAAPAIETAAYVGTIIAVQEHPEWRDEFQLAFNELKVLEASDKIGFNEVLAIVKRLPVNELKSRDAQLAITAATIFLNSANTGAIDIRALENFRIVVTAMRSDMQLALDQTTTVASN